MRATVGVLVAAACACTHVVVDHLAQAGKYAPSPSQMDTASGDRPSNARRMAPVRTWAYQLQGEGGRPYDYQALAAADADLLVIDASNAGKSITPAQVATLQRRPDGRRRYVLSYMSIGEAESYRFYWRQSWGRKAPAFLAAVNPDWPGNYKVRYWHPAWQSIIVGPKKSARPTRSYLDQIIELGFDGVYLDCIDAFEYFGPDGDRPERPSAAADMARFVLRIAQHARVGRKKPDFLVVPQNGAGILHGLQDDLAAAYLAAVDAIGAEDSFFFGDREEDNPLAIQHEALADLRLFQRAGVQVLAVDYLRDVDKQRQFLQLAQQHQYVPYVGVRALDRLVTLPSVVNSKPLTPPLPAREGETSQVPPPPK